MSTGQNMPPEQMSELLLTNQGDRGSSTLSQVRSFSEIKNLGYQQMQRRQTSKQSTAQVKKSLGFRSRTHYETMLKSPTAKLRQFTYPQMQVSELKQLVKALETADGKQKSALRKDAQEKTKAYTNRQETRSHHNKHIN